MDPMELLFVENVKSTGAVYRIDLHEPLNTNLFFLLAYNI